jgi:pimeloyl-ACP methyl ester carboxylesterase
MKKTLRIVFTVLSLLLIVMMAGFVLWGETPARPMAEALAALQPDEKVSVTTGKWLVFAPAGSQPDAGFIFYPGGRVDFRAYAPAARQIAAQGYLVIIPRMPLNLAVFDAGAAEKIIAAYPEIQRWAIGGHSLGGAMAANFVKNHPEEVQGLVLWASYPADSDDLTNSGMPVASIYGTLDGQAEKIPASRALLPAGTRWTVIEGGNHAQFGWYGAQAGDNPATISRGAQQEQAVAATLAFLEQLQ